MTKSASIATAVIIFVMLGASAGPAEAQSGGARLQAASAPRPLQIRMLTDSLLECHFYLKTHGNLSIRPDAASGVNLDSEISIYTNAQKTITNPEVWRWFETVVAEGPDVAAVSAAAGEIPPALNDERSRVGLKMLLEGFTSAYPKFSTSVWPIHLRSLNRGVIGARKRFLTTEKRIASVLMEKMGFGSIDLPVNVYVVVRSGGVTSWGKTAKGYFVVIGMAGVAPLTLIESSVHEATHIVDTLQSFGDAWVLKEVRDGLRQSDLAQVDIFLHGLIAYNAGELVKRFIAPAYVPAGIRAPAQAESYRPYISTYEVIWNQYLDGKYTRKGIVAKLIEEFKAVQALRAQSGASS